MDDRRGDGEGHLRTLVMGASIVMEWIRAIEECLRCELPGKMNLREKKEGSLSWQETPRVSII